VDTVPGNTIRVWIVDVDGTLLFMESVFCGLVCGEEHARQAAPELEQEIQQIVDSIRFL
jgi:hypothetical protein